MPVRSVRSDATGIEINAGGRVAGFDFALLSPGSDRAVNALRIRDALQASLDTRVPLNRLPRGDPDRAGDPNLECAFWDGADVIYRETVIVNVVWDGTTYAVEQRQARPVARS